MLVLDFCVVILLFLVEISSKGIETSVEFGKETLLNGDIDSPLVNPLSIVDTSSITVL